MGKNVIQSVWLDASLYGKLGFTLFNRFVYLFGEHILHAVVLQFSCKILTTNLIKLRVDLLSTFVQKTYPSVVQKKCTDFVPAHTPVLLKETLEFLALKGGETVVDATLGLGGHAIEFLKAIGPKGFLYAFEKDQENLKVAEKRLKAVGENFHIFFDSFASLKDRLEEKGVSQVDAVFFDLGLSSPHVDDPSRGFSFLQEGPLDMRFDRSKGMTAADILNSYPEKELADIFYKYGEERASRRLAKAVVDRRKKEKFGLTTEFANFVVETLGKGKPGKHRATLVFQALRIAVNEELTALELGLSQVLELLAPHGRVVVISYHSLEDRIVKHTFKQLSKDYRDPNDPFGARVLRSRILSLPIKKPITPSQGEKEINSRSRSAILRVAEKLPST